MKLSADSTMSEIADTISKEGLNARFDEATGRFFISAKETGSAGHFEISAVEGDAGSALALSKLGLKSRPYSSSDSNEADEDESMGTMITGQDAEIMLNGVKFTSSTNTFEVNGLTITAQQETGDEEITLTTSQDTDGIYDMIKNFFTKYNELINEMDKLYNADSASKYEPLTSEEKDAMSDSEVEEWEKKIKDSLLRRDSTLSGVANAMKQVMLEGATVNGKKMYLTNFGIETLVYFKAKYN